MDYQLKTAMDHSATQAKELADAQRRATQQANNPAAQAALERAEYDLQLAKEREAEHLREITKWEKERMDKILRDSMDDLD